MNENKQRIAEALEQYRHPDAAGSAQRKAVIKAALDSHRRGAVTPVATRLSDRDLAVCIVRSGLSEADGKTALGKLRTARAGESVAVDGVSFVRDSAGVTVSYARPRRPVRVINSGVDVAAILGFAKRAAS